jgi:hypothetical protein
MQFAKVFDVDGTQVLCVLAPSERDGTLELRLMTYVGDACVVLGSSSAAALAQAESSDASPGEGTEGDAARRMFEGFDRAEAEKAYRLARRLLDQAARDRSQSDDASDDDGEREGAQPESAAVDPDFGLPWVSRAVH